MYQALMMAPDMGFQTNVLICANLVQCFENYYMGFYSPLAIPASITNALHCIHAFILLHL